MVYLQFWKVFLAIGRFSKKTFYFTNLTRQMYRIFFISIDSNSFSSSKHFPRTHKPAPLKHRPELKQPQNSSFPPETYYLYPFMEKENKSGKKSHQQPAYFQFIIYQKGSNNISPRSIFLSHCQGNSGKSICHPQPAPFIVSALFCRSHD